MYFTWENAYSVHKVCFCIAQNVCWITVVLSKYIAAILPCTKQKPAAIMRPDTLCSIHKSFKKLFHHNIVLKASVFYMGKVHTVCIRCVLALHIRCVESRLFYPTISQRSCHVQHSTCNQNVAIHPMFNNQEFQAAFSPLYCTVCKWILHGKKAYSVHTVSSCIAQNVHWITGVLSNNIAAILTCTALYLQP